MKSKGKYNNENNLYENLTSKSEKVTCIKKKHKPRIIVSDHMGKYSASISNPSKMSNNPQERQEVESLQDVPPGEPGFELLLCQINSCVFFDNYS